MKIIPAPIIPVTESTIVFHAGGVVSWFPKWPDYALHYLWRGRWGVWRIDHGINKAVRP